MDYTEKVNNIVATAQFGDLIEFAYPERWPYLKWYSHWGVYDGDGYVIHFAAPDEGEVMKRFRNLLSLMQLPFFGDLLLGETKIRRQLLSDVKVPRGANVSISNNRHARRPSAEAEMRQRRDALLDKVLKYDLLTLNCEHFATFVRYGESICNQVPFRAKNTELKEATEKFKHLSS
ncbi:phospholipase A and acyltransferase 3-like [Chanos chanos]|uniref:Phospholipase A and acyltransferase 3-like n=1 Tax=Chanos chanos TaxID=29144 RepID=A0A6J2WAT6_CHACN|nr:phospholipase A and acyltransferase 3-like [Chanos chanos]